MSLRVERAQGVAPILRLDGSLPVNGEQSTAHNHVFRRELRRLAPNGFPVGNGQIAYEEFYMIPDGSIAQLIRRETSKRNPDILTENWDEVAFREVINTYGKSAETAYFLETVFRVNAGQDASMEMSWRLYEGVRSARDELQKAKDVIGLSPKNFANPDYLVVPSYAAVPTGVSILLVERGLGVIGSSLTTLTKVGPIIGDDGTITEASQPVSVPQRRQINTVLQSLDAYDHRVKW